MSDTLDPSKCPICDQPNQCGLSNPVTATQPCWCFSAEIAPDPICVYRFAQGLYFRFENLTTMPAELDLLGSHQARLTLHEGRYHQVKRMFGHFNNKVTALHRERMGRLLLDPTPAPGQYSRLTQAKIEQI